MQTATDYRQAVVRRSSPKAYGAIGLANITLVGVMERTGEIGLRRAMGATRRHIAAQFLFESASMGAIGGIIGASVGILIVAAVSAYQV